MTAPASTTPPPVWRKDPADVNWFVFRWDSWLQPGETIISYTVQIVGTAGVTIVDTSQQANWIYFRPSGGTNGQQVQAWCQILTSNNNTYNTRKTIFIRTRVT